MNVMTSHWLCNGTVVGHCRSRSKGTGKVAIETFRLRSHLLGQDPISLKARFVMRNSYLKQLRTQREQLEARLELHIARYCFGEGEVDDGTEAELRQRIEEISDEIAALEAERGE